jgi:hypothetical protein
MTRDELVADFGVVRAQVVRYFETLPLDELFRRQGDAWAPVDDLRHITRSLVAVTRGMSLSPEALADRFGSADGPTRSRGEIGALALEGLAAGGRATAELSPEPVMEVDHTEAYRQRCLTRWQEAAGGYESVLSSWPDEALDRYRLPHPFLGVFNLREWAHFNALHALHHLRVAERRLGRGGPDGGPDGA